jgi:hypothetical protein
MKVVLVATVIMSLIAIVYLYNTLTKKEINLKQCQSDMTAQKTSGDKQIESLKDKCQSDMKALKTSGDRQIESLKDKCQSDMTAQKTSGDRQIESLKDKCQSDMSALKTSGDRQIESLKDKCQSDMSALKTSGDRQIGSLQTMYDKCQSDMTALKTSSDRQIVSLQTMYDKCQSDMTALKTSGDRQIESLQTEIDKLSGLYAKSQLDIISSDNTITDLKKSNYDLESQVVSLKSKITSMMAPIPTMAPTMPPRPTMAPTMAPIPMMSPTMPPIPMMAPTMPPRPTKVSVVCNKIVLYDDQKGSLNLSQIYVYDEAGNIIPLTSKNVSMVDPWDVFPISNIVDNNEDTFMHNKPEANASRKITVEFYYHAFVSSVVIINRKDCCQTRANGLILKTFLNDRETYTSNPVKDFSGSAVYENGGTNPNNPNAYRYIIFMMSNREPMISNKDDYYRYRQ